MRVLLVDDDGATRALIEHILAARGHEVFASPAAEPAWEEHQRHPFDLAVLDWVLPGMDGLDLCRRIRSLSDGDRTVVLMITGRDTPDDLQQVLDAGANDYLAKPAEADRVNAQITIAERTWHNIHQRKLAEAEARENSERLMLAAAGTNDGFWDAKVTTGQWTSPDNVVWYSTIFKRLLGYQEHEFPDVLGSWIDHLHSGDRDRVFEALRRHIEDHVPYDIEYRLFTKSGEARWFQARGLGVWDDCGRLTRMAGSIRDITEHREKDERLRESEEKWRSLVENVPDIIVLTDCHGNIRFVNRTVPGVSMEQALRSTIFDFAPAEYRESLRLIHESVFREGRPANFESAGPGADGAPAWYNTRFGPIERDGQVVAAVLVSRDISERHRFEESLQKQQKLLRQMLDAQERERRLIAYEIHDGLVQELHGSLMHLEAFQYLREEDQGRAAQEFSRGLLLLRSGVSEARRLISGLRPPILDESGIVAAVEFLVNEAREMLGEVEYIHSGEWTSIAPTLETAIFRVVQEALTNVRRHSHADRARVELSQAGDRVLVEVRDWGIGFDSTQVREGSFGLAGIRERARLLGGHAEIETAPKKGTTIRAEFPLLEA